jgi:phosphocarrier protein
MATGNTGNTGSGDGRVERSILIQNELGLHARAATKFVQLASKYPCEVHLAKDGHEVNGKSIMGVLMLVASKGSTVTIRARGERAAEVVSALAALIDDKFGEDR